MERFAQLLPEGRAHIPLMDLLKRGGQQQPPGSLILPLINEQLRAPLDDAFVVESVHSGEPLLTFTQRVRPERAQDLVSQGNDLRMELQIRLLNRAQRIRRSLDV